MDFNLIKRRTTDFLHNVGQSLPAIPSLGPGRTPGLKGTWEKISVPPLKRSSHSLDVVGGTVYIFGGEVAPRKPVDNDMHTVTLAASGASADYYAIKAKPAKAAGAGETADDKDLSDIPLDSEEGGSAKPEKGKAPARPVPSAFGEVPVPRVGHATGVIGHRIFLFGGRAGPESKPLDEGGRVWVFDTRTNLWSYLDPASPVSPDSPIADAKPSVPAPRSFHSAVATDKPREFSRGASTHHKPTTRAEAWREWVVGDTEETGIPQAPIVGNVADKARDEDSDGYGTFIIHGGCLEEGRASDVWAFDVHSRVWQKLPDAPGKPRGGAALAINHSRLYRFGGFNGETQEGGQLDFLELGLDVFNDATSAGEVTVSARGGWESLVQGRENVGYKEEDNAEAPLARGDLWPCHRSVSSLNAIKVGGGHDYLVVAFGEREASGSGHEAAGKHLNDVWAFKIPPSGMSALALTDSVMNAVGRKTGDGKWIKVEMGPYDDEDDDSLEGPVPRGWIASGTVEDLEDNGIVIWGGLDDNNKRLGDGWILRLG
ncbi:galactose oxidase [Thozetella sp. PMI_491]|nr:galactose oxidase [Thozetella sp. PMI_491]